ncbi:jg4331 [Pararge aegeria aegeria]|uniref:Jg4331 protein n=1 Tax=Pararge aegeria aegeria TaxID=348720 RepID=A0A8S4SKB2_9NEOP|nr:jg4331 [Pararge aegeria aegeria]
MRRRGSLSKESSKYYDPKPSRSAPVTPCDSETSTWSETYENFNTRRSDKASYEASTEGMWWWRRPLGVRRTTCRRCGASSSSRPLQMTPEQKCSPLFGRPLRPGRSNYDRANLHEKKDIPMQTTHYPSSNVVQVRITLVITFGDWGGKGHVSGVSTVDNNQGQVLNRQYRLPRCPTPPIEV